MYVYEVTDLHNTSWNKKENRKSILKIKILHPSHKDVITLDLGDFSRIPRFTNLPFWISFQWNWICQIDVISFHVIIWFGFDF